MNKVSLMSLFGPNDTGWVTVFNIYSQPGFSWIKFKQLYFCGHNLFFFPGKNDFRFRLSAHNHGL